MKILKSILIMSVFASPAFAAERFRPCTFWKFDFNAGGSVCLSTTTEVEVPDNRSYLETIRKLDERIKALENQIKVLKEQN